MINKIIKEFRRSFPERKVTKIFDFDDTIYLVEAPMSLNATDYNNPYFGYIKKNGQIIPFNPVVKFDQFIKVINGKALYSYK